MTLRRARRDRRRGAVADAATASACPLCNPTGTTFANEVAQADFILYGTLANAKPDPKDPEAFNKGTTDLTIEVVIKSHDMVKGKKSFTIPRYVPPDRARTSKYLIFFNVVNGATRPVPRRRGPGRQQPARVPEGRDRRSGRRTSSRGCSTSSTTSKTRTS